MSIPSSSTTDTSDAAADADAKRWTYGLIVVAIGLGVILIALLIVTQRFSTAADVGTIMGVVVSPVGTIVAAYFGIAAGSSGKAQADDKAHKAQVAALKMAAASEPAMATEVVKDLY
jgi:cell shape-determining protein MreC